jgi:hypothetical protein
MKGNEAQDELADEYRAISSKFDYFDVSKLNFDNTS